MIIRYQYQKHHQFQLDSHRRKFQLDILWYEIDLGYELEDEQEKLYMGIVYINVHIYKPALSAGGCDACSTGTSITCLRISIVGKFFMPA